MLNTLVLINGSFISPARNTVNTTQTITTIVMDIKSKNTLELDFLFGAKFSSILLINLNMSVIEKFNPTLYNYLSNCYTTNDITEVLY